MILVVGLGNPGEKYEKTRHNLGFMAVEHFLKDFEPVGKTLWTDEKKLKSDIAKIDWQPKHGKSKKVILVKPKTYMNNSGMAVSLISQYFNIPISDIWIVHDDVDLPLGNLKIRFGGASAGHRGIESIIETLGTDKFWRFRIGSGHPLARVPKSELKEKHKEVESYVLGKFSKQEWGKAREVIERCSNAIKTGLEEGLEKAMNRFNTR